MIPSVVRLVIPYAQIRLQTQTFQKRLTEALIAIPQNTDVPRSCQAVHSGRKTVHRNKGDTLVMSKDLLEFSRDGVMVGSKNLINPLLPVPDTQRVVSRNIDTIALDRNRGRMIRRTVEIYHQPRKSRNQQNAV